ncbi:OsmC-like protein [Wallemia mellicola]|uniref:OsmC-like protein n=2 Tax=Wallemia mellicola TaxID=1708541 RepID=A0A4T0MFD6_9BASI|nr:OsmC-like protein [Wallemia mellicola CBS 633.66]TIB81905.1 OsmC-like protein [Wallemia mellicola]EIM23057.1 OsmC-like protein [Wallemia mellicola CBS 633.66]TIB99124.1 OsmC-like protein [Wallemia mellicola]TIC11097.1 OsmC-like protein [Wallemia mellicola]TIC12025.1 OsmC-like protein [Wallemia mellicola]|eukprot:XP_006957091.1 OsmC-like protein [Wallemia mellicola CBS 633.66]
MFSRIATVAARAPRAQLAGVSSRRTMLTAQKGLYTAKASATGGGRADGVAKSETTNFKVSIQPPGSENNTNPEELVALGYSTCFLGAMKVAAQQIGKTGPSDAAKVFADVTLNKTDSKESPFTISTHLKIEDTKQDIATLAAVAKQTNSVCPYEIAFKGNIKQTFTAIGKDGNESW